MIHRYNYLILNGFIYMLAVGAMLMSAATTWAQPANITCRVLDPELQATYAGACLDGLAEGTGEAAGTARYTGQFKAGKKHGKGVKVWPATGDRYDGNFADDRKEGTGIYVWGPNSAWPGERYAGAYRNDQRYGLGTYEWASDDRYIGLWANDQPTGPATPKMRARARAYAETAAAVGRPGIAVCREMKVGIATLERIKGTVMTVADDGVSVRIDDPGLMGHVIHGMPVNKGTLITDDFSLWTPC